jgi:hypothetical protein
VVDNSPPAISAPPEPRPCSTLPGKGRIEIEFAGAAALAIQTDGKIDAAGGGWSRTAAPDYLATLARYNKNGSLDRSFATTGKVTIPIGSADALAIQCDGRS